MRSLSALALVSALTAQAAAEEQCLMDNAVYTDGELGYELRFRHGEPWEFYGMMTSIYELRLPDGRELWGYVSTNMGTSRDIGSLHFDCARPGPEGGPTQAELEACRVWRNNIYAIVDGRATVVPNEGEPAAPSLLLADLGRALRYTVLTSPGEEPWDQFDLKGCEN